MTTPLGKIEQTASSIESDDKIVDQNENDLRKYAEPIVSQESLNSSASSEWLIVTVL